MIGKAWLISGIILACVLGLTGCSSSAEQISPSNPLIIDATPEPGAAPLPAVTPPPESTYTPPPVTPEPQPEPEPEEEPEPEPELELSASCRVKNWGQDYWDYTEEWADLVEIYIEIENTGDLDIDYYEIFYVVECSGGKDYYGMINGLDLEAGEDDTVWTIEMVNGREVVDVDIDDWELDHY